MPCNVLNETRGAHQSARWIPQRYVRSFAIAYLALSAHEVRAQDVQALTLPRNAQTATRAADPAADRAAVVQDSVAGLGWMRSGHRDWSRYTHPGECAAAIQVIQRKTMHRIQWTHRSPAIDTLSTDAREAGRACASQFAPQTMAARNLPAYLQLAVLLNDIPLAKAIIDTRLSQAKTLDEKGSVIADAVASLDGRYPEQVALGDSLAQRVATLGPKARWWNVPVIEQLPTPTVFDTTRIANYRRALKQSYAVLSHDERMKSSFIGPTLLSQNWLPVLEYRRTSPSEICPSMTAEMLAVEGTDTIRGSTFAELGAFWKDQGCPGILMNVGHPITTFSGGEWFTPSDTIGRPNLVYPRPSHVTLVYNDALGSGRPSRQLAIYKRLYAKYANDGLDIVLVHKRRGFAWNSPSLPPAVETRLIRWYDHEYLKLPFPVAVYDSAATDVPQTMFIGRDGRGYVGSADLSPFPEDDHGGNEEAVLEAFVKQALAKP